MGIWAALQRFDIKAAFITPWSGSGERGSDGMNHIDAWAASGGIGYRFERLHWKPRTFWQYDYASGDRNPSDGEHGTFDTMYPTAHDRLGIADVFGWQNIISNRVGITVEPRHRWTLTGQYLDFWLASATDAAYNTSGVIIIRDPSGRSGTHLGKEYDAYTWYELNRHLNLGIGVGHFQGGHFIDSVAKGTNYNYPYFAINFKRQPAREIKNFLYCSGNLFERTLSKWTQNRILRRPRKTMACATVLHNSANTPQATKNDGLRHRRSYSRSFAIATTDSTKRSKSFLLLR